MGRKFRLKPAGYITLAILVLIIGLCVFGIVHALSGDSKKEVALSPTLSPTPEVVNSTVTPVVPTDTPDSGVVSGSLIEGDSGATTILPESEAPTPTPPPKATATPRVPTSKEKKNAKNGVVTGDNVNLRSGPGTEYEKIKKYSKGDTCQIYAKDGKFYFVKMDKDNKVGFISTSYCQESTSTATEVVSAPNGTVLGKVTASKVALRSAASKTSTAITQLSRDDQVYIYHKTGEFYYVEVAASGKKGYCYASYVKASGTVPTK